MCTFQSLKLNLHFCPKNGTLTVSIRSKKEKKKSRNGHETKQNKKRQRGKTVLTLNSHFVPLILFPCTRIQSIIASKYGLLSLFKIFSRIVGVFQPIIRYASPLVSCVIRHLLVSCFPHSTLWHESWLHI